jgi:large subunit ribosomal protein L5
MATKLIQDHQKTVFNDLKGTFGWVNVMQTPKIEKVIVSVGVGKMAKEKGKFDLVADRLSKITGQKAVSRGAKKSYRNL